jgi:opacity protein-like surface antigen
MRLIPKAALYKMKKLLIGTLLLSLVLRTSAQEQAIVQEGEIGFSVGAAQYFGDLNPNPRFNTPNLAASVFFRKNLNGYVAIRVAGSYAFLGYSDKLNGWNEYLYRQNLSFNTNIWEGTIQGDFNFFKYYPGSEHHRFTPYVTFGIGVFNYNPYTYLNGQKIYLRPLGTEGQGSAAYPDRKTYGSMAFCFPIGAGVKYSVSRKVNIGLEFLYRFTTTDYIDDVSTTYAPNAQAQYLPNGQPTVWYQLEDRSSETGTPIGIQGRQRGYSNTKDSYITGQFTVSFNLFSYKCPSAN